MKAWPPDSIIHHFKLTFRCVDLKDLRQVTGGALCIFPSAAFEARHDIITLRCNEHVKGHKRRGRWQYSSVLLDLKLGSIHHRAWVKIWYKAIFISIWYNLAWNVYSYIEVIHGRISELVPLALFRLHVVLYYTVIFKKKLYSLVLNQFTSTNQLNPVTWESTTNFCALLSLQSAVSYLAICSPWSRFR